MAPAHAWHAFSVTSLATSPSCASQSPGSVWVRSPWKGKGTQGGRNGWIFVRLGLRSQTDGGRDFLLLSTSSSCLKSQLGLFLVLGSPGSYHTSPSLASFVCKAVGLSPMTW